MITGVMNYRFEINGMHFDAAIDFGCLLHPYTEETMKMLPVELYNLDLDWDIKMSYFDDSFREIENQELLFASIEEDAEEWCKSWIKEDGTYDQFGMDYTETTEP